MIALFVVDNCYKCNDLDKHYRHCSVSIRKRVQPIQNVGASTLKAYLRDQLMNNVHFPKSNLILSELKCMVCILFIMLFSHLNSVQKLEAQSIVLITRNSVIYSIVSYFNILTVYKEKGATYTDVLVKANLCHYFILVYTIMPSIQCALLLRK